MAVWPVLYLLDKDLDVVLDIMITLGPKKANCRQNYNVSVITCTKEKKNLYFVNFFKLLLYFIIKVFNNKNFYKILGHVLILNKHFFFFSRIFSTS